MKPNGMTETESKEDLSPLGTEEFVEKIANLSWEKKALNLRALRVFELVNYTDWFVVMSARSDRQAAAICDHIQDSLSDQEGLKPLSVEGRQKNQWVVLDYGDVVIHIFYEPVRVFYDLERLWEEAPELPLSAPAELTRVADPYGG